MSSPLNFESDGFGPYSGFLSLITCGYERLKCSLTRATRSNRLSMRVGQRQVLIIPPDEELYRSCGFPKKDSVPTPRARASRSVGFPSRRQLLCQPRGRLTMVSFDGLFAVIREQL